MYSNTLGRWVELDPAGYVDGANMYEFVGDDPADFVDPSGLEAQLPKDVVPPSGTVLSAPVQANMTNLAADERAKLADPSLSEAQREAKLKSLKERQKGYSCVLTIKSITYIGSDSVIQHIISTGPPPGGGNPVHTLYRVTYVRDKFEVKATLKCNCGVKQGDLTYTAFAIRNKHSTEIGRTQPPAPPPVITPIPGTGRIDVPVPPGISGGTVRLDGYHPPG